MHRPETAAAAAERRRSVAPSLCRIGEAPRRRAVRLKPRGASRASRGHAPCGAALSCSRSEERPGVEAGGLAEAAAGGVFDFPHGDVLDAKAATGQRAADAAVAGGVAVGFDFAEQAVALGLA